MTQLKNMEGGPMEEDAVTPVKTSLSKSQKKRQKRNRVCDAKRLAREKRKKPEKCEEPPLSSNIVLPTKQRKGFISLLDTDEKLLAEIRSRFEEASKYVLQCRPVPQPCPPGLLKDLCPLTVSVRLPTKRGAGYAFLVFRNEYEMKLAEEQLASKCINGKEIKVSRCCQPPRKTGDQWCHPSERTLADIDCKKLVVTRLHRATTRFDLAQVFRRAVAVKLPTYDDGSCKGTCILTYKSRETALQAFETRNGTFIRGSPIYVNFMLKSKLKPALPTVDRATSVSTKDLSRRSTKRSAQESGLDADEQPRKEKLICLDAVAATTDDASQTANLSLQSKSAKRKQQSAVTQPAATAHPKLLEPHQLKRFGGRSVKAAPDDRLSALEALLNSQPMQADSQKPKRAKKVKRRAAKNKGVKMVGKRGR